MVYYYGRHKLISGDLDWRSFKNAVAVLSKRSTPHYQYGDQEVNIGASDRYSFLPSRLVEYDGPNSRTVLRLSGPVIVSGVQATAGETWCLLLGQRNTELADKVYPLVAKIFTMPETLSYDGLVLQFENNDVMYI